MRESVSVCVYICVSKEASSMKLSVASDRAHMIFTMRQTRGVLSKGAFSHFSMLFSAMLIDAFRDENVKKLMVV